MTAGRTEKDCRSLSWFRWCCVGGLTAKMFPAVLTVLLTFFSLAESKQKDFYTFKVVNSRGKLVSLEKYRGSVSLVVNVASECGFTEEHYNQLQQLQRDFGPYHFNVLAFPCNQFGQQEPGSDKEIDSFVRRVYGVSFPLFSKIAVVGIGANNVYKYLLEASGKEPDWNFWKYLIDVNGKVVDAWGPKVSVKEIRPKIAEMVRQIILKKKEEL
ncbi:glutathione peroxidase 7 [Simochromis diagramma]|uniref:glutathione peroxidase 7 n=1 Tax=Simochromis diagramma TaxID=43689 RepID=UPI001A7ED671|nr:glutathione peroxidase 7 [Simochromis diagramma]